MNILAKSAINLAGAGLGGFIGSRTVTTPGFGDYVGAMFFIPDFLIRTGIGVVAGAMTTHCIQTSITSGLAASVLSTAAIPAAALIGGAAACYFAIRNDRCCDYGDIIFGILKGGCAGAIGAAGAGLLASVGVPAAVEYLSQ